ncbi:hypothetical protein NTR1_48 [Nocardia phage NTR1]|nr:hypothetical protein NTR1_48 [Nocardia phage NTR1]
MTHLDMGFQATATAEVTYGPLRLAVAKHFGIDPADVMAEHVAEYEAENEEKGQAQWQSE